MAYRFVNYGELQGAGKIESEQDIQSAIAGLRRDQGGWIIRSGSHRRFLCLGQ
jgi:hypothetical protein